MLPRTNWLARARKWCWSAAAQKNARSRSKNQKETGNTQVEFIAADLSTNAGVQETAHEFKKRHTRLDVLLNNAGAMFMSRQVSSDGVEMTIALNHLNYFHLTILLLDVLKASGQARIVSVSSDAHRGGKINFDDIQFKKGFSGFKAYSQSKLANVLFTYEMARKLEGTKVYRQCPPSGLRGYRFWQEQRWINKIRNGATQTHAAQGS